MNPEDITKLLNDLSERLAPLGIKGYEILTRQMMIDGIIDVILIIALAVFTLYAWPKLQGLRSVADAQRKKYNESPYYTTREDGFNNTLAAYVGLIALIVADFILFPLLITDALNKLLNPEWAAIEKLINLVKG